MVIIFEIPAQCQFQFQFQFQKSIGLTTNWHKFINSLTLQLYNFATQKNSSEKQDVKPSPVPKLRESRYPPDVPKGEGDKGDNGTKWLLERVCVLLILIVKAFVLFLKKIKYF
jgi:hypothetical protein